MFYCLKCHVYFLYKDACKECTMNSKVKKKKKASSIKGLDYSKTKVTCLDCDHIISLHDFLLNNGLCEICVEHKYVDIIIEQDKKKSKKKDKKVELRDVLGIPKELWLPDEGIYQNRFPVKSDSSNNVYIVSTNSRNNNSWGCACPGWKSTRKCKHLRKLGLLPPAKTNNFASGYKQDSSIPTAGELKVAAYSTPPISKEETSSKVQISKRKISLDD